MSGSTSTPTPSQPTAAPAPAAASQSTTGTHPHAPGTNPSSTVNPANQPFRPLNVRDALSYLDKVKQQFSAEFQVYDSFLTIMKEFKTQHIDTPGVIDRVSTLFRGHPSLIQGFNTFLPPGYRIDCVVSAPPNGASGVHNGSNTITVTTPMGVTTRTQDVAGEEARKFVQNQPGAAARSAALAHATSTTPSSGSATPQQHAAHPPTSSSQTQPAAHSASSTPVPAPAAGSSTSIATASHSQPPATQPSAGRPYASSDAWASYPATSSSSAAVNKPGQSSFPAASSAISTLPKKEEDASADAGKLQAQQQQQQQQVANPAPKPAVAPTQAAAPASSAGPPIMEFNHAINYVNKIKNRYTRDPETYKTFLEILQTYQKETRPIQEVYTQVTALFHGAPDLLDEFKAFLPDTSEPQPQLAPPPSQKKKVSTGGGGTGGAGGQASGSGTGRTKLVPAGGLPGGPVGVEGEKKKRAAPGMGERSKAKRAKTSHAIHAESPPPQSSLNNGGIAQGPSSHVPERSRSNNNTSHDYGMGPPLLQQQQQHLYGAPPPNFPGAPRLSPYDTYLTQHRAPTLVQPEEFTFFDRVKKHIDDRGGYVEFLKLLNLFTQEIIDVPTLLEKSLIFIGKSDELVASFKDLVGWDPVRDGRIRGEDWIIDNEQVLERPPVLLHLMKSYGPSYRKLPETEIDLACSGRDALEWSVLNDDWVAYATWLSEGSGAHRKNQFEDALYNSEQDRHWFSIQIESISRTIYHLEPLAARIALMTAEERVGFKLDDLIIGDDDGGEAGWAGPSPSVFVRVVKKIYGKDQGNEILEAIKDNPVVAVPIVLARLKQKDEEWRRAEREWNKVWREIDMKNFYRALDHQGVTFKVVDKKTTTTSKSLTTEIETLKRDHQQKRLDLPADSPPLRPHHQFELGLPDRDVLFDILKLTFSFLDRDQNGFSAPERARVEAFLRLFVPLLFNVPHADMEANLAHADELDQEEDVESDAEPELDVGGGTPAKKNGIHKKGGAADLRKRLLTHAATAAARVANGGKAPASAGEEKEESNGITSSSSSSTPAVGDLGDQTWIQLMIETEDGERSIDNPLPDRRFNFFTNTTFYCLVRTIHTLYHRLSAFKALAAQLAAEKYHRLNPLAVDLGLAVQIPVVDGTEEENPAVHYYEHMLELLEKLFEAEIDQSTYEEHLRYMGGIHVFPLFTVDKLISNLIKHIHTINGDQKCSDLVTLLEKDRAQDFTTPRQQIAYRMEAEATIGTEESLYRLEWISESKALTIQLLGKEDLTLDDATESEEKMHSSWVASFALTAATEGIGAQVKAPLLKRNRKLSAAEDPQEFKITPGLEAKVVDDSYQLKFIANTEDYLHRVRPAGESKEGEAEPPASERRHKRFQNWLDVNSTTVLATASNGVVAEEVRMEL